MFSNFGLFCKEYQRYLKISQPIDVRLYPSKLIQQLKKKSNQRQFRQTLMKKTKNGFKIMRRLTVVHLLMMNSDQFSEIIQKFVQNPLASNNQWLNQKCIRTYYRFLKKAFISREYYMRTKQMFFKSTDFQIIFYTINLFAELFHIVEKMPLLGRYYKDSNSFVTCAFIEGIAVQSQKLYTTLKNGVIEILGNHGTFIKNKQDQKLLKAIIQQSFVTINEQMKKLFLDKYFYPLGRGICIKLFRIQEQNEQTIKIIKGIISNHQNTQRMRAYTQLEQTLFPEQGKVNLQFYEKTLRASNSKKEQYIVNLQEVQEQILATNFEDSDIGKQNQEKNLRETSHLTNPDYDVESQIK